MGIFDGKKIMDVSNRYDLSCFHLSDGEKIRYVPETDSTYAVTSKGRLFSFLSCRKPCLKELSVMRMHTTPLGYKRASLRDRGKGKNIFLHRLVGMAFIPNPNNYSGMNHKDGIKLNNSVDNLEWCSQKMNVRHAFDTGLSVAPNRHLTNSQVLKIKDLLKAPYYGQSNDLAKVYGVSDNTICNIKKGHTWKHLNETTAT